MTRFLHRAGDAAIAGTVGLAVGVPVTAAIHDLVGTHPAIGASWALLGLSTGIGALTLGRIAARVVAATGRSRALAAVLGATVAAATVVAPLLGLLGDDVPTAATLAWTLGEEDNAQIVGVAREVIMDGPRGGDLAGQYGTGFVVAATTLGRMVGAQVDVDPRVSAISAFTVSTALAVLVLALGAAIPAMLATPPPRRRGRRAATVIAGATAATTGALITAALGVAVVLPMRTGFLSFVWAFAWIAIGVALLPLAGRSLGRPAATVLIVQVLASTLLLVRSWPFLLAAALPPLVIVAADLPWRQLVATLRRRPVLAIAATLLIATATVRLLLSSALGEVLSYGREAFTAAGSSIRFDRNLVAALLIAGVIVAMGVGRGRAVRPWTLAVLGPGIMALASWVVLRGISEVVAGGEFNYAGIKLMYGVVAVTAVTVLPAAAVTWTNGGTARTMLSGAMMVAVLGLLATSPTVRTLEDWAARLSPATPPHAVAMVEAIGRTTPDLPIRCRPEPGILVTEGSRLASYFCIRWTEDALNVDRRDALRGRFLYAPDRTFDGIVAEATADGLYGFAYVIPVGPGWFGWDGVS